MNDPDPFEALLVAVACGFRYLPPACSVCGTPHVLRRDFNGGDAIVSHEKVCSCSAESAWRRINELADDVTGIDGNVIRGWLDTTVREALFPDS